MKENIFTYGTLQFPEIVFALTGKGFKTKEAVLKGYKRYRIFDDNIPRKYPAIYKNKKGSVNGMILMNVDEESLNIIDFFEDKDYTRQNIEVQTNQGEVSAITYVWKDELKDKLRSEWSKSEFKEKYLADYIKKTIPRILDGYCALNYF